MSTTTELDELFDAPAPHSPYRRYWIAALGMAVVALIVTVTILNRLQPPALAQLFVRSGNVEVRKGPLAFDQAAEGQRLEAGDAVRTGSDAQARVNLFDGSVARMDEKSVLELRELDREAEPPLISLVLDSGRVWSRVEEGGERSYEVRMRYGLASAQGTNYLNDCRNDVQCYVAVFGGTVLVESIGGGDMTLGEGECAVVAQSGLAPCDIAELGLVDNWVIENLAEDQRLAIERAEQTPEPTVEPVATTPTPAPRTPTPRPPTPPPPPPPPAPTFPPRTLSPTPSPPPPPTPTPTQTPEPTEPPSPSPSETADNTLLRF